MRITTWAARCTPALSALLLLVLLAFALLDLGPLYRFFRVAYTPPVTNEASYIQLIFAAYSIFVHLVALGFPIRVSFACWQLTEKIEEAHARLARDLPFKKLQLDFGQLFRIDEDADEKSEVRTNSQSLVVHVIMIPCYKEDIENLKDTLRVLASHRDALNAYDVYLAMEERDPQAVPVAESLISIFRTNFQDIQYTLHPSDIPGEAAGKSSNISWCARHAVLKHRDTILRNDVLMTTMDSDTYLSTDYFSLVQSMHLANRQQPNMTLYVPPIIFDRNAHNVPLLVRTADMLWCAAGISMCGNSPAICIPVSVYTATMPLIIHVGGWDTGPSAIGEDLHMLLKCYFSTQSKLKIEVVPSPASQCNVSSNKPGIRGWLGSHQARYHQGLRHMWGCLDTGYALTRWSQLGNNDQEVSDDGSSDTCVDSNGSSDISDFQPDQKIITEIPINTSYRNLVVFTRLYEAHLLPIHLSIILLVSTIYTTFTKPAEEPTIFHISFTINSVIRLLSFATMVLYLVFFYGRYHRICVRAREAEMKRVGLHDGEASEDSFSHRSIFYWGNWADCICFAVSGLIFGSVPAVLAAFSHMFTDKLQYVVSKKPEVRKFDEAVFKQV